jgi:hypothetical protein
LENKETLSSRFFFFESWQTAENVMVLPCDFTDFVFFLKGQGAPWEVKGHKGAPWWRPSKNA